MRAASRRGAWSNDATRGILRILRSHETLGLHATWRSRRAGHWRSTSGRMRHYSLGLPSSLKSQEPGCVHMFPSDASVSERSESFP